MYKLLAISSAILSISLLSGCSYIANPLESQKIPSTQVQYDENGKRIVNKENGQESSYVAIQKAVTDYYQVLHSKKFIEIGTKEFMKHAKKDDEATAKDINIFPHSLEIINPHIHGSDEIKVHFMMYTLISFDNSGYIGEDNPEIKLPSDSITLLDENHAKITMKKISILVDNDGREIEMPDGEDILYFIKVEGKWVIDIEAMRPIFEQHLEELKKRAVI